MSTPEVVVGEPKGTLDEAMAALWAWAAEEQPKRLAGLPRKEIVGLVGDAYERGADIRAIQKAIGGSYGRARDLVAESHATLRPEGFRARVMAARSPS